MTVAIDTLKLAERLEGCGFTWRQASTLAHVVNEMLVECGRSCDPGLEIHRRLDFELAKLNAEHQLAAAKASTRRWMIGGGVLYLIAQVAIMAVVLAR